MAKHRKKVAIIPILILILVIAGIGVVVFTLFNQQTKIEVINKGVAMRAWTVDENGVKIYLDELSGLTVQQQTILGNPTSTGFVKVTNLGFDTSLDNTNGDSEVTITDVSGSNPCSAGNNNAGCSGIANLLGLALDTKWDPFLPNILPIGQASQIISSNQMDLSSIELGLIDFRVDVIGTFLDSNGNSQSLSNKYGQVTLKVNPESCSDGTSADVNSQDSDNAGFCSTASVGKYCRINANGEAKLTDRASLCGCPSGLVADGEVCTTVVDCTTLWGANQCNPDGGVSYCQSDGTIVDNCNVCGLNQCPVSANGDDATSCSTGTTSSCQYPSTSGEGFVVSINDPNIPNQPTCGDGVKSSGEQCDTNDYGGSTCATEGFSSGSLSCDNSCNIVTSSCVSNNVRFRTSSLDYPANIVPDNWIAYAEDGCGLDLKGHGFASKSGGIGSGNDCTVQFGQPLIANVPHTSGLHLDVSAVDDEGDGIISLHDIGGGQLYLCENNPGKDRYGIYRYRRSTPNNAVTSKQPSNPPNEVSC